MSLKYKDAKTELVLQAAACNTFWTDQFLRKATEVLTPLMLWALGTRPSSDPIAPASEIVCLKKKDKAFFGKDLELF